MQLDYEKGLLEGLVIVQEIVNKNDSDYESFKKDLNETVKKLVFDLNVKQHNNFYKLMLFLLAVAFVVSFFFK